MDEREIWLKISNSCAAIAGSHSRLLLRIRSSSANVAIRRPSAAKHAARPRRTNKGGGGGGGYQRSASQGTSVICSGCGQQTTVPFEPRGDRPVYCQNCFQSRKTSSGGGGRRRLRQGPLAHRVCSLDRAVHLRFQGGGGFRILFMRHSLVSIRSRRHCVTAVPGEAPPPSHRPLDARNLHRLIFLRGVPHEETSAARQILP